jgi:branched-chain amino acid transport system permease protein
MTRTERRAAPKPVRIPSGDRPVYSTDEGHT